MNGSGKNGRKHSSNNGGSSGKNLSKNQHNHLNKPQSMDAFFFGNTSTVSNKFPFSMVFCFENCSDLLPKQKHESQFLEGKIQICCIVFLKPFLVKWLKHKLSHDGWNLSCCSDSFIDKTFY